MNTLQTAKLALASIALLAETAAYALPTIHEVADGSTGEYCGEGYGISVNVSTPSSGYTVKYAESEGGPWLDELKYVNVCVDKPIYYQVTAEGYETKIGSAKVTVTPKELTSDYIGIEQPPEGHYVYDGQPKVPNVSFGDGDPSILTEDDWEVSFADNVNAGTATATFTGKGNYTGTCTEEFEIARRPVTLTSGTKTDFVYDGKPHAFTNLAVTAGSFVAGEGIATSNWATVTEAAEGEVDNAFDYTPIAGTKLENYDLTIVTGKIAVVAPPVGVAKVELDAMGGKMQGKSVLTQEVDGVYGVLPGAVRDGYLFAGWFLGVTSDAPQAQTGGAVLADGDHTLFARWTYDPSVSPNPETLYSWEAIDANTARITGFTDPDQALDKMMLPDRIGGLFVTEIAAGAFANAKCGATELVLPMFCSTIGDKAFLGVATLASITFVPAREWGAPLVSAAVSVGRYAFSGSTSLMDVLLPKEVSSLGDYAFLNTRNLSSITILGRPAVGAQVFRSSGIDAGGVTVHLDPALAADTDYMAALEANMCNVTVRTDAVVTGIAMSSLGVSGTSVRLTLAVEKAAAWGQVDTGAIRVVYRKTLVEPAVVLVPSAATRNTDGSVSLEVVPPEGASGFFQAVIEK